jgi:hypothetical protein
MSVDPKSEREAPSDDPKHAQAREPRPAEAGAESYGGDADTEPSVTEDEVEAGMERDQTEG